MSEPWVVKVQLINRQGQPETFLITGDDASNYNISTIMKKRVTYLRCPQCQWVHSDRGAFAVIYHQHHRCNECGYLFDSDSPCISNSVMLLKELCGDVLQKRKIIDPANRKVITKQSKWPGGMQNMGITSSYSLDFIKVGGGRCSLSWFYETYRDTFCRRDLWGYLNRWHHIRPRNGAVSDGSTSLTYLKDYLCTLDCAHCGHAHFDTLDEAVIPHTIHSCTVCKQFFPSPHNQPAISNPLIRIRETLYANYRELMKEA